VAVAVQVPITVTVADWRAREEQLRAAPGTWSLPEETAALARTDPTETARAAARVRAITGVVPSVGPRLGTAGPEDQADARAAVV
jgi:hypothetical protein